MKRRLPPFAAVKAFEAAARHCNFQLAAEELGISASAVSHQVKALEDFIAMPLFVRRNNRLLLRDEGRVMLVSTHNLGSVPEFCDQTILVKGTVLDYGPTAETFTHANLQLAFGGVLRHFVLGGADLHDDDDARAVTILTDDERPVVIYDEQTRSRTEEGG